MTVTRSEIRLLDPALAAAAPTGTVVVVGPPYERDPDLCGAQRPAVGLAKRECELRR